MNNPTEEIIRLLTLEIGDCKHVIDQQGKLMMQVGRSIKELQEELKAVNMKLSFLEVKQNDSRTL
jgi:hypothetical protein